MSADKRISQVFLKETVGTLLVVNGVVFKSATKLPRSQLEFDRYVMGEKKNIKMAIAVLLWEKGGDIWALCIFLCSIFKII